MINKKTRAIKLFQLLAAVLLLCSLFPSCSNKEVITPAANNTPNSNLTLLTGQKWILYQYRVGSVAINYSDSDTLVFLSRDNYTFNQDTNYYSLYSVPGSYKLNLDGTRWGNLSGTIFDYNLTNGDIQGLKFTETFTGNQSEYYLWIRRF